MCLVAPNQQHRGCASRGIARTISRVSDSSRSDVERLVAYLAQGGSYQVTRGVPEHWYVSFFDLVLTAQWQAVYAAEQAFMKAVCEGRGETALQEAEAAYLQAVKVDGGGW